MDEHLKNIFYKGLTWCFFALWVLVAIISMYHTGLFFAVGNPMWLACIMSVAFEVGLALTLFSILTTDNHKSTVPWVLMVLLTIVQICGNVYSVFKYMIVQGTATDAYTYINGSFLHWFVEDMPKTDVLSIISIMLGAILPIVALFMTDMVANNFKLRVSSGDDIQNKNAGVEDNTEDIEKDKDKVEKEPAEKPVDEIPVQEDTGKDIEVLDESTNKSRPLVDISQGEFIKTVKEAVDDSSSQHTQSNTEETDTEDILDELKKDKNIHIIDNSSDNYKSEDIIDIHPEIKSPPDKNPFVTIRPVNK